jgi:hypothetical protein
MTPRNILTVLLAVGSLTLLPALAEAKTPDKDKGKTAAKGNRPAPKKDEKPAPIRPTITTISADSITMTDAHGKQTYKIDERTEVTFKGQKATVDSLKPGMRVSIVKGSDPTVAGRISANEAPKDAPKPEGAKRERVPKS